MDCADKGLLSDLSYCQGENAIIHIGELENYSGYEDATQLRVLFTNLATGHKTVIAVGGEFLPEIVIHSEDFTPVPEHGYEVKVVRAQDLGGITPLRIKPYEATYAGYDLSTEAFDALLVRFVKVFTATATIEHSTEQWFTLA